MSFDAGSIDTELRLDRFPFSRDLRAARAEADAFARNPIKIRIELDQTQLRRVQASLTDLSRDRSARLRIDLDTAAAEARIAALEARIRLLGNGGGGGPNPVIRPPAGGGSRDTNKDLQDTKWLLSAIVAIGPALIPIAGATLAIGAGFVGLGAAGIFALKGIQAEIKNNTALGKQYNAVLNQGKTALEGLEHTAAANFLSGFEGAVTKLNAGLPQFNLLIGQSATRLGTITSHLAGGLVQGFQTFDPLITKVEREINSLAGDFEKWAGGPGGAKFAQTLSNDFDQVIPVLGHLVTAVGRVISAFAPAGGVILHEIDAISSAINSIPVPVLQAAATAFVAIKTAALVSGGLGLLSKALVGSAEGAGALGGKLGFVGAALSRIAPYAAAAVGLHFAFDAAATATSSWATSSNNLQYALYGTSRALHDLFSLHFSDFGSDLFGQRAKDADAYRSHVLALNDAIQLLTRHQYDYEHVKVTGNRYSLGAGNTGNFNPNQVARTNADEIYTQQTETYRKAIAQIETSTQQFYAQIKNSPISQQSAEYTKQAGAIDKADQSLNKYLTSGDKSKYTYQGVTVGIRAWDVALAQTNDDVAKAEGIINGQIDALNVSGQMSDDLATKSARLSKAVGEAGAKYGLTTAQVDLYSQAMGISGRAVANGNVSINRFVALIGAANHQLSNAPPSIQTWVAAVQTFASGTDTIATRAQLMGQAMVSLQGDTLSYANTVVQAAVQNQQLVTDFNKLSSGAINLKKGLLDVHDAGAAPVLGDLANLQTAAMNAAEAVYQNEVRWKGAKGAAADAADTFRNDTNGALKDQARQLGITNPQAEKLAQRYFHWPKNAKTLLETLGQDKVQNTLGAILRQLEILNGMRPKPELALGGLTQFIDGVRVAQNALDSLHGHTVTFTNPGGGRVTATSSAVGTRAAFGTNTIPPNTAFTVGEGGTDRSWEGGYTDAMGRATILSNAQAKAAGFRTPVAYASGSGRPGEQGGFHGVTPGHGGGPGSTPTTPSTGSGSSGKGGPGGSTTPNPKAQKWYEYRGLWYQGRSALNQAIAAHESDLHAGQIEAQGHGKLAGYGYRGTGYGSLHEAQNARTQYYRDRVTALRPINRQAGGESSRFDGQGFYGQGAYEQAQRLDQLTQQSTSAIQGWVSKIASTLKAARQAKAVPSALVQQFDKDNHDLNKALSERDKWMAKEKAARQRYKSDQQAATQYGNQVRDAWLNQFDIGTSGNGYAYGIKSSLDQAVANTQKFEELKKRALKMGLDPRLIRQLEGEGSQGLANLEAIVNAGQNYVDSIDKDYEKLYAASSAVGQQAQDEKYRKRLADDTARIKDFQKDTRDATREVHKDLGQIRTVVHRMQHDLDTQLERARKHG